MLGKPVTALLCVVVSMCLASCDSKPESSSQDAIRDLISFHIQSCLTLMGDNRDAMTILARLEMSTQDLCTCQADGFYGVLSGEEVDELVATIAEQAPGQDFPEPWASRMSSVTRKCMASPIEPASLQT